MIYTTQKLDCYIWEFKNFLHPCSDVIRGTVFLSRCFLYALYTQRSSEVKASGSDLAVKREIIASHKGQLLLRAL